MKKLFLLILISVSINATGQKFHKATGDKPLYSHEYGFQGNDSLLYARTVYTYNNNQQVIKEISYPPGAPDYTDSTIKSYDGSDRIISSTRFLNNRLYQSQTWIYDENNKQIDYYNRVDSSMSGQPLDSTIHIIYKGVRNFDEVNDFSSLLSFFGVDLELRDCDTILINSYNKSTSSWDLTMKILPIYQNGNPSSATMTINDFDVSDFATGMGTLDITIQLTFAYSNNKLMTIKGDLSTTVVIMIPIPISIPDAIVLTNQYSGDLLTETKTEINISYAGLMDFYVGTKQKYGYNSENNIFFMSQEYSMDAATWEMVLKTYYYYDNDIFKDLAIVSLNEPFGQTDIIGESINISVTLENKSPDTVYQNVNITALIRNPNGETIETLTDIIPSVNAFGVITHTFTDSYTVPNESTYSITVYIDSYDNNPSNDTLQSQRTAIPPQNITNIDKTNISMNQNFPNPANDVTLINYNVPTDGKALFTIYNVNGQSLLFTSEEAKSGENMLELNVSNLASGIYFYTMEFNGQRIVKKMNIK